LREELLFDQHRNFLYRLSPALYQDFDEHHNENLSKPQKAIESVLQVQFLSQTNCKKRFRTKNGESRKRTRKGQDINRE
jgi:hypothetical protein